MWVSAFIRHHLRVSSQSMATSSVSTIFWQALRTIDRYAFRARCCAKVFFCEKDLLICIYVFLLLRCIFLTCHFKLYRLRNNKFVMQQLLCSPYFGGQRNRTGITSCWLNKAILQAPCTWLPRLDFYSSCCNVTSDSRLSPLIANWTLLVSMWHKEAPCGECAPRNFKHSLLLTHGTNFEQNKFDKPSFLVYKSAGFVMDQFASLQPACHVNNQFVWLCVLLQRKPQSSLWCVWCGVSVQCRSCSNWENLVAILSKAIAGCRWEKKRLLHTLLSVFIWHAVFCR